MRDIYATSIEALIGVLPVILLLLLFNRLVLRVPLENSRETFVGLTLTVVGLVLFSNGLKMGLLPLSETVGINLPSHASVWLVLAFVFILGFAVTLAEPSLQALGGQIEELSAGIIPKRAMILTVALGIGIGVTMGVIKIVFQIPTAKILLPSLIVLAILIQFAPKAAVGIAFDAAGVTTGPVTVPTIIAVGIGIATALGGRDPLIDGFGLIALCLIGVTFTVLILGMIFKI
ncbi:MAG: DUF1538 domain-containing protein [Firmicutes bacterium]|nr:DUF1538 domain-containing protein [Bacillota bacterium]